MRFRHAEPVRVAACRAATRECFHEADRIFSMLPVLDTPIDFVRVKTDLGAAIDAVLPACTSQALAQLLLATRQARAKAQQATPVCLLFAHSGFWR